MALLNARNELLIGGAWVDVTSRTRGYDKVLINDGSGTESSFLLSGTCRFVLNNRDGLYSNDNPNSIYCGLIGRNIQFRSGIVGVKHIPMRGTYDSDGDYDGQHIGTSDKAALDIVGDIDIRIDVELEDWHGTECQWLATKYRTDSAQRSWYLEYDQLGYAVFSWSTDGTTVANTVRSDPLPYGQGRGAIRCVLDVDNGAGGHTVTWYTAPTLAGPWTLQRVYTGAGVTSIFASTTPLNLGTLEAGAVTPMLPMVGKIYGFELRNSAGTLVAKMDPSAAARNATSINDGLGNTWFSSAGANVEDTHYRFWGEVAKLPQRWDETGEDVYVPITAQDILSRLMNGARLLQSPITRNYRRFLDTSNESPYITGLWPMESGSDDEGLISAERGNTGFFSLAGFGSWDDMPGAGGALTFSDDNGTASGNARPVTTYFNGADPNAFMTFNFQLPSVPVADRVIMQWNFQGGTVGRVTLTAGTAAYTLRGYLYDGTLQGTTTVLYGVLPTSATSMQINIVENTGVQLGVSMQWYRAGDTVTYSISDTWYVGASVPTVRWIQSWRSAGFTGKSGMKISHMVLTQGAPVGFNTPDGTNSINAFQGEDALGRFERLMREEGVQYWTRGLSGESPPMGRQGIAPLIDLAKECMEVVGGLMYAPRDKFGVTMRSLAGMAGRSEFGPVLDYGAAQLINPLEPDRISGSAIRNAVTASRPRGGSRTRIKTSGSLNVNDPADDPQGAGQYDVPISRNVATDAALQTQADWEVALGTWDENRYPTVTVQLDRPELAVLRPDLVDQVRAMHLGDAFSITNLPIWMGSQAAYLITRGRTETYDNFNWLIAFNAAPYGPYGWGIYGSTARRVDSTSTTLLAGITSSATTAKFALGTAQTRWSQVAVPYDVMIAKQRNTVTEVGGKGAVGADLGQFESSAANWQGGTASNLPVLSTAQFKYGTRSALVTVASSPASVAVRLTSSTVYAPVTPGATYTLSCWVYSSITLASNFGGLISWHLGAALNSTSTATAITATANTWTQLTFTATAPVGVDRASYGPTVTGSPANGTLLYFDAIELIGTDVSFQPVVMTRGVDGVTKALATGDQVRIVNPMTWGRV